MSTKFGGTVSVRTIVELTHKLEAHIPKGADSHYGITKDELEAGLAKDPALNEEEKAVIRTAYANADWVPSSKTLRYWDGPYLPSEGTVRSRLINGMGYFTSKHAWGHNSIADLWNRGAGPAEAKDMAVAVSPDPRPTRLTE